MQPTWKPTASHVIPVRRLYVSSSAVDIPDLGSGHYRGGPAGSSAAQELRELRREPGSSGPTLAQGGQPPLGCSWTAAGLESAASPQLKTRGEERSTFPGYVQS